MGMDDRLEQLYNRAEDEVVPIWVLHDPLLEQNKQQVYDVLVYGVI